VEKYIGPTARKAYEDGSLLASDLQLANGNPINALQAEVIAAARAAGADPRGPMGALAWLASQGLNSMLIRALRAAARASGLEGAAAWRAALEGTAQVGGLRKAQFAEAAQRLAQLGIL
jgi:hypothetical protein